MAVSPTQKRQIKEEAGFKCAVPTCNAVSPLEIHHIVDQADGGPDTNDNLLCLCANCHRRYHNGQIPRQSIINYKRRVVRISADLVAHEFKYLESLNQGQDVELDDETVNLARGLERRGLIDIVDNGDDVYELNLTQDGRDFIR